MKDVLTLVLAGGKGTRLEPLSRDRAKPAVPFGGVYRIIDFALSNCINSGLRRVLVLTQYKARSLDRHLALGWNFLSRQLGEFVEVLPPQQRIDEKWYKGTADAIYQNIYTIEQAAPKYILILSGDHIYKMDYGEMIRSHIERQADATVACLPVPLADGTRFGIMDVDGEERVISMVEKPAQPPSMPGSPGLALASMGIYLFTADKLFEMLCVDAIENNSHHDFGTDILPPMLASQRVFAYRFRDRNTSMVPYWRDVGTVDAYYQANMDLVAVEPELNLYDHAWPIRTYQPPLPPPKFVHGDLDRRGLAIMSMVCQGCIVSGGQVRASILSPNVHIHSYATVESSLLFEGVDVGRHSRIRRAIIDKDVKIPHNTTIGYDLEHDRRRGFTISEQGIVVIPKAALPDTFTA